MVWILILILLVTWSLGFGLASAEVGHYIHILLAVGLLLLGLQLFRGDKET